MNEINYFLLTKVEAKNISIAETIANFCLTPVRYLWNGKKIDFIQDLNLKAVQIDFIYGFEKYSWIKTALIIVLFVPGVALGSVFKAYAICRHHVKEDDIFIKACLKTDEVNKILVPTGQHEFGNRIAGLIDELRSKKSCHPCFSDTHKPLFLSEIESIKLLYENNHLNAFGDWDKQYIEQAALANRRILDHIHLLWNLSFINFADHYANFPPGIEVSALKEINPSVVSLQVKELKFTEPVKVKDFFSHL